MRRYLTSSRTTRRYLASLAFWVLFLWLAVSGPIALPAIGLILFLDHMATHH